MHSVTLGFAEIYQPLCREGANGRVFDVFVNDVPFLVDMNVVDFVPCFSAHFEQGLFEADDTGHIVILFNATSGKAFVSMIEIQTVLST